MRKLANIDVIFFLNVLLVLSTFPVTVADVNCGYVVDNQDAVATARRLGRIALPNSELQPLTHDIAVINATSSKTGEPMPTVGQNYSISIYVMVENQGEAAEIFNLTAYYDGLPILIHEQWLTLEQMEIFWSMGDVNEDGYINVYDGHSILCAYGTSDPNADINGDGIVDTKDVTIWASNYDLDAWAFFKLSEVTGNQTTVSLPSGNSMKVTFIWDTTNVAKGNYTISAYATPVLGEIDTSDNYYTDGLVYVGTPGDINADGIVDVFDAVILAGAAGSLPCEPRYRPNSDINEDGIIDVLDAVILAGCIGQTNPPKLPFF